MFGRRLGNEWRGFGLRYHLGCLCVRKIMGSWCALRVSCMLALSLVVWLLSICTPPTRAAVRAWRRCFCSPFPEPCSLLRPSSGTRMRRALASINADASRHQSCPSWKAQKSAFTAAMRGLPALQYTWFWSNCRHRGARIISEECSAFITV
eukprot:15699_5